MYKRSEFDRNINKQAWFNRMDVQNRLFLVWLWMDEMDSIGVVEPDMDGFERFTGGLITRGDIDLQAFVDDCNNDRKERMMTLDRGARLWFNPTVIFKGCNEAGFRLFTTHQRDAAIIRKLSMRQETRDWFSEQVIYNERIQVNGELLNMVYNNKKATECEKEFAKRLAKLIGVTLKESKELPDTIKASFGHQCQYCGGIFKPYELEIDHIVPVSKGGHDKYYNMVPACKTCNGKKTDKDVHTFLSESGFDVTEGLKSRLQILAKKRLIMGPGVSIKGSKKEKYFTYAEVQAIHFSDRDTRTMEDFIITAEVDENGRKKWKEL